MQVYFLHHSAICIKTQQALLIFDYFMPDLGNGMEKGSISDKEIAEAKRVYVFASHSHHDHFNKIVFEWREINENIVYLLDDTIDDEHDKAIKMTRGEEYSDGYLYAKEFGSTDIGGSFYVEFEGNSIFHAGDLNFWHWRGEGDEKYTRQMKIYFDRELKFIRNTVSNIDIAFFPVDKRMGALYDEGADIFIDVMKPSCFVPIHFMNFEDTIEFAQKHKDGLTKIYTVNKNGDRLI